tara:strand:+ start:83 stop:367 length:285 start_codon:yes stop_codon:yes gene_type:complete
MAKKNDKGFQPVGDRILITRQKIDEKTESGIILPANHKRKMFENLATVIAVGDGENISEHITEGCTVYIRDEAPSVEISDGVYLVMQDAVYGVL